MSFTGIINSTDTQLLLAINSMHSTYLDNFMFLFSNKFVWIAFYASLLAYFIIKGGKQSIWIIIALILCIALSDQISSGLIKDLVQRPRPTREPGILPLLHIVNGYTGGRYGFVSSHAANTIGLAILTSAVFKNKTYTIVIILWAIITSYSRIYLGVHYPLDILGGMAVGTLVSLLILYVLNKKTNATSLYTMKNAKTFPNYLPTLTLLLSVGFILVWSFF